jgi:PDZ domain-containing protein
VYGDKEYIPNKSLLDFEDDVTKGKRIMGTGGINLLGEATTIGGEKQKVVTAHNYLADIFFVPKQNYESAKEKYDTLETNLQLVSVETFNDVINYLNNMEDNNG